MRGPYWFDPLFSVRYEPHALRGGDTVRSQHRQSCCVSFFVAAFKIPRGTFLPCRWLSPPARPYPSASSAQEHVDATHPLRGSGTYCGSLRPEHHPGRRAAEGRKEMYTHQIQSTHNATFLQVVRTFLSDYEESKSRRSRAKGSRRYSDLLG